MKKIILPVLLVLFLGLGFACYGVVSYLSGSVCSENDVSFATEFEVEKGMTAKAAGEELEARGVILSAKLFYAFARFPKVASFITKKPAGIFKVQTGYYELTSEMNLAEIFEVISTGKEKSLTVSIPEGLTILKVAERLKEAGLKNCDDFAEVALKKGNAILKKHGFNIETKTVEGFLYPDTYQIPLSYNSEKIIDLMIENFLKQISASSLTAGLKDMDDETLYKTIILASIVEREYRVKDEAPSIAGVFNNRLSINMPLQSCATVEYIITEVQHKPHPKIITYDDLEIKSPFNTYRLQGLPPSPISNPGFTAISAAVNPEKNDYLYFTLTDSSLGRHTFSRDLNSHIKATDAFRTKGR